MTVVAIFTLLVAATVSAQVFGLRMYRISETKLTATAGARSVLNRLQNEIRSAKLLSIGNGDASSFAPVPDNTPHSGNALKICTTTDTNSYVCYFWDATDSSLKRTASGNSLVQTVANNITNQLVFQAEDFQGNVVTNAQNNRVIKMTLQFYQRQYPLAGAANGGMYDYYQLQTRIARRAIE